MYMCMYTYMYMAVLFGGGYLNRPWAFGKTFAVPWVPKYLRGA